MYFKSQEEKVRGKYYETAELAHERKLPGNINNLRKKENKSNAQKIIELELRNSKDKNGEGGASCKGEVQEAEPSSQSSDRPCRSGTYASLRLQRNLEGRTQSRLYKLSTSGGAGALGSTLGDNKGSHRSTVGNTGEALAGCQRRTLRTPESREDHFKLKILEIRQIQQEAFSELPLSALKQKR